MSRLGSNLRPDMWGIVESGNCLFLSFKSIFKKIKIFYFIFYLKLILF